jgi:molybdate transport system substrate-binding protein
VVTSLEHLPRAERIVLGTPGSPIGRYSDEVLRQAGEHYGGAFVRQVQERVVSREANVRQVLAKVRMGEADAALVYRSDTLQQAGVHTVELPDAIQPDVRYPVATVAATAVPQLADAWVALMMRAEGQAILQRAGLRPIAPPQQVE